jgi:hypothetical protein
MGGSRQLRFERQVVYISQRREDGSLGYEAEETIPRSRDSDDRKNGRRQQSAPSTEHATARKVSSSGSGKVWNVSCRHEPADPKSPLIGPLFRVKRTRLLNLSFTGLDPIRTSSLVLIAAGSQINQPDSYWSDIRWTDDLLHRP